MSVFCFSRRVAALGMIVWITAAFAGVSQAQFLKAGETAPAPEFRASRSGSTPTR